MPVNTGSDFHGAKELGREDFSKIPNGIPGTEHRPALMYTYGVASGRITAHQMMKALSENPARLFGMYPRKGALQVGADADIVAFDPGYTGTVHAKNQHQNVDYTPYEGMEVRGRAETVLLCGQAVVENGGAVQTKQGRYVHRGPSGFWR